MQASDDEPYLSGVLRSARTQFRCSDWLSHDPVQAFGDGKKQSIATKKKPDA